MSRGSGWILVLGITVSGTQILGCSDNPTMPSSPPTTAGWYWQNPLPQGNDLRDVAILDDHSAVIVGYHVILRTDDKGRNWQVVKSGDDLFLFGVYFGDASHGLAVGLRGRVLRTTNGGRTWEDRSIPRDVYLNDVFLWNGLVGTAVGYAGEILRTLDGGITWERQNSGVSNELWSVWFRSPDTGFVVGNGVNLRTDDAGTTWRSFDPGVSGAFGAVSFAGARQGVMVGSGCVVTEDGGTIWQQIPLGAETYLTDARFIAPGEIFAVGWKYTTEWKAVRIWSSNGTVEREEITDFDLPDRLEGMDVKADWIITVAGEGLVSQSVDRGLSWERNDHGPRVALYGVAEVTDQVAVAVGMGGTILRLDNARSVWKPVPTPTEEVLLDVDFPSPYLGIAVGGGGTLLRTTDGGATWSSVNSSTQEQLQSIKFVTHEKAIAVGYHGTIIISEDGGLTWEPHPSGSQSHLEAVDFGDALTGIAVSGEGSGTILRTTDGGESWTPQVVQHFGTFTDVCFVGPKNVWLVGYANVVLKSQDGGETWKTIPFPAGEILSVAFSDASTGIGVGGFGQIFWTFDGGESWLADSPITSSRLWGVTLPTPRTAIAVGSSGTVIRTDSGASQLSPLSSLAFQLEASGSAICRIRP